MSGRAMKRPAILMFAVGLALVAVRPAVGRKNDESANRPANPATSSPAVQVPEESLDPKKNFPGFASGPIDHVPGEEALNPKWNPMRLTFPPPGTIPEVQADRFQLDNGMVVYLARDAEFPDLTGSLLVHTGTMYDPPEKAGLARLTGVVMRSGGTAKMPGDSLDGRLEAIGASLETSIDETSGSASFYCLKEYGEEVLGLLRDLLREPAFPQEKLDLARLQVRRQIASRNDDPNAIGRRVFRQVIFGQDHPYARDIEFATLNAITRTDLQDFHKRFFAPNRMILTITGDLDPAAMKAKLTALFGDWPRSAETLPADPPVPPDDVAGGIFYAEKTQVTQSTIYVGQVGIRADSPDLPALDVLGEILGGGFSSRIVSHIRTLRGLAYSAGASSGAGYPHPGIFQAYALTRSDSTLVTLDLLKRELNRITTEAPSDDEVGRARESLLNSFVFNFRSRGQVVSREAYYEFYGYPRDFLTTYQESLRKVTAGDILRVAKAHLHPDRMKVLIVGDATAFERPISSLGQVQAVDLTIPGRPAGGP